MTESLKRAYDIRVRRWRKAMTGCAWRAFYHDGRVINWIEAPQPRRARSAFPSSFMRSAITRSALTPTSRCEEEYYAWAWAIAEIKRIGVQPDARVTTRVARSMEYADGQGGSGGIKSLPTDLEVFLPRAA